MKILLANLGNRNITYQGKTYLELSYQEKKSINFRDWTHNLLKRYEEIEDKIDLNIINPLVYPKGQFSHLILYYSDQSELSDRTNQDTLWEAEIIKNILTRKYHYTASEISLRKVASIVIDNGGLMKYYREELKGLKQKYPNAKFTICDAGGTAQQKMAFKVMAEYHFKKDQYDVIYTKENKIISDVNINEYRNIIDSEIAIQLLHKGDYNACIDLLGWSGIELFHKGKDYLKKLFAHTYFRFSGNSKLAMANLTGKERNKYLKNYFNQSDSTQTFQGCDNLSMEYKILIIDSLRKVSFYYKAHRYSQMVLAFSQFYELLFDKVLAAGLDKERYGYIGAQTNAQKSNFEEYVKSNHYNIYNNIPLNNKGEKDFSLGHIGIKCLALQVFFHGKLSELASHLSIRLKKSHNAVASDDYNITHVNELRNKVAHEGLYITSNDIEGKYSYVTELMQSSIKLLGVKDIDLFEKLNKLIEDKILRI